MMGLLTLPPAIVELEICQFLDAASLAHLSCTNRELHVEIDRSPHWATHVTRSFGIAADKVEMCEMASSLAPPPPPLQLRLAEKRPAPHPSTGIKWRDVFLAACMDSLALASALQDNDILQVYHRHPQMLLSRPESKIRDEIVLMHGLRRFPASSSLLSLYAQVIRRELVVQMLR